MRAFKRGVEEKHAADKITNGVVGKTGITKPIAPIDSEKNPIVVSKNVFI